ncbi:MAG TPA: hypothetical protein VGU61_19770 [Noviherbaspirillum sp.]|jgi:hypothetical protein|uniref:hypothetical protein n=1 Tax=Noviherbaspirillum sp. TaxID=1926288 RepID=UPI002DDD9427|nr:hypothetical protein [Noviherbaspirillum sp.]HEV2612510.1 hypothetical protein [Noviherbaspirillum sp.]
MDNQTPMDSTQVMAEMQKHAQALKIEHPVLYADQMAAFAFGPFVSKLILAQESFPPGSQRPVVTVVMPTNILHQMASAIIANLSNEEHQKGMRHSFEEYQKQVELAKN